MAILRWRDPFESGLFGGFDQLHQEVNSLFSRFSGRRSGMPGTGVFPPINVSHDADNVYVSAELPGIAAADIDITVEEDTLVIKGERKPGAAKEGTSFHRREREAGTFSRSISLPTRVATDKVGAEANNGILRVTLPKAEEVKPKKIDIKVA